MMGGGGKQRSSQEEKTRLKTRNPETIQQLFGVNEFRRVRLYDLALFLPLNNCIFIAF